jgi:hypothetical protein
MSDEIKSFIHKNKGLFNDNKINQSINYFDQKEKRRKIIDNAKIILNKD